jgi:hypothetical protein
LLKDVFNAHAGRTEVRVRGGCFTLRGREEIKASVKGQIGEEVTIDSTTGR